MTQNPSCLVVFKCGCKYDGVSLTEEKIKEYKSRGIKVVRHRN